MHLDWESRANDRDLPQLREQRRTRGGRIIVYQRVFSFIFFTRLSNHYRLVDQGENRTVRGLTFFLPSLLLGWWSFSGYLHVCYALAHNLLGGVDVTAQVDSPHLPPIMPEATSFARRRFLLCLGLAIAFLIPPLIWVSWVLIR